MTGSTTVAVGSRSLRHVSRRPSRQIIVGSASLVVFLLLWEGFGRQNRTFASFPTAVWSAAGEILVRDPSLRGAMVETLQGLFLGFAVSFSLAIFIGYLMAAIRTLDIALLPYVQGLYSTPRIAIIPLLVLWVGIGFELRVTIVVLSSVFPMILTIREGAKSVSNEFVDVATAFCASPPQRWWTTTLPGSLPFVFASTRIGLQRALIGVIVAEMAASVAGTGRLILQYGQFFQTDKLMVPIILIGLFSIGLSTVLRSLQNFVTPWRRATPRPGKS